jgi:hypothetical protein
MTRGTLAGLAIDVDPLIAGVIEERSEEEGVGPVRSCPAVTATAATPYG